MASEIQNFYETSSDELYTPITSGNQNHIYKVNAINVNTASCDVVYQKVNEIFDEIVKVNQLINELSAPKSCGLYGSSLDAFTDIVNRVTPSTSTIGNSLDTLEKNIDEIDNRYASKILSMKVYEPVKYQKQINITVPKNEEQVTPASPTNIIETKEILNEEIKEKIQESTQNFQESTLKEVVPAIDENEINNLEEAKITEEDSVNYTNEINNKSVASGSETNLTTFVGKNDKKITVASETSQSVKTNSNQTLATAGIALASSIAIGGIAAASISSKKEEKDEEEIERAGE